MGFKYKAGLILIVTVIAMWVTSCEVTQGILEDYEYPFAVTYLGTSFLALHLPLAFLKIWLSSLFKRFPKRSNDTSDQSSSSTTTDTMSSFELEHRVSITQRENVQEPPDKELTNWNLATIAACIAPIWFLTEYFTNAALAQTTVARTTILVSTSGLFTLFIGAAMGVESVNVAKVISVIVSMAGVAMTMLGKTWVPGNSHSKTSLNGKHSLIGDLYALLSAMIYGLFTVLLKKLAGVEGQKVDIQKLYGFIGLFILLTLWWLVWPLTAMGMEPKFTIPHSAKMTEIIVANCFVGSFLPDYFLALGIVWTSPLVSSLGVSLTIPLAMLEDILIHKHRYSSIYIFGSAQNLLFYCASLCKLLREQAVLQKCTILYNKVKHISSSMGRMVDLCNDIDKLPLGKCQPPFVGDCGITKSPGKGKPCSPGTGTFSRPNVMIALVPSARVLQPSSFFRAILIWSWTLNMALQRKQRASTSFCHSLLINKTSVVDLFKIAITLSLQTNDSKATKHKHALQ
ncbi:hypothetical protein V2J09_010401 [Rumex salicifolius]